MRVKITTSFLVTVAAMVLNLDEQPKGKPKLSFTEREYTEIKCTHPERFTNLTSLDIRYTSITEIPPTIGKLPKLNEMFLYDNQIVKLPKELGNLKSLTSFTAWANQIEEFPIGLAECINLKEINLASNKIKEIPNEIRKLSELNKLYLCGNEIEILSDVTGF